MNGGWEAGEWWMGGGGVVDGRRVNGGWVAGEWWMAVVDGRWQVSAERETIA